MITLPRHVGVLVAVTLLLACSAESDRSRPSSVRGPGRGPIPSKEFGRGPCADDPRIGRVGFPGTPPVLVKRVEPITEQIAPGVRGVVIIEIIIGPDGVPCSVAVLRSLRRDADEAAVNALKQWRFIPAKLNGQGWPVVYNVTVAIER